MDEIIQKERKFNHDRDWEQFHTPVNLAKSIVIEAAEIMECFQWSEQCKDLNALQEEIADVMLYCIQLADTLGLDPLEIMKDKIEKNNRKYPVEKAKGNAKKYNEL